jgi:energy-coupling factor transporter ATP-binding protein EcfA2
MINFENYSFRYEESQIPDCWAIRKVSLSIGKGEIALILGRSGCGKSTLGFAVSGIIPHLYNGTREGKVTSVGMDIENTPLSETAKRIGLVFQDPEVQLFALTVEDEVAMSLESFGVPREEMAERVRWAMSVCGLIGMEMNMPSKLSGGQKQKVAIAAVLARDPDLLVFDEPTGNLDPLGTRSVYKVIKNICVERGRTVLLIEHDLAPVIDFIDRVFVMEEGEIIFSGNPREVFGQVDMVYKIGAKVPEATKFSLNLCKKGLIHYPQTPLLPEEAAQPLQSLLPSGWRESMQLNKDNRREPRTKTIENRAPIVSFKDVIHQYTEGFHALDGVNLDIFPGEFVSLVGMNGAGKTTMALHIMGILTPTKGDVFIDGRNTREMTVAELARTVGLIFQNPNHQLFKPSVESELRFGPENLGWGEDLIQPSIKNVLKMVNLEGLESSDPESLSTGQKKRVAIASTLIMNPKLLLLDEPTTGQDQRTLGPILELVSNLNQQGVTVVMITHDMEVAMKYATRVVVLTQGKVIADGSPEEIFLHDAVLQEAGLYQPELIKLASAINGNNSFWVNSLEELETEVTVALQHKSRE